jgi:hypothetical protein
MTSTTTRISFVLAASLGLFSLAAFGQSDISFKIKYELEINLADESRSLKKRENIPDGSVIPVEIGRHQAEMKVTSTSPGHYAVELSVSESEAGTEADENVTKVSFSGEDGVPVWFEWRTADVHIKMNLVASSERR